MIVKRVGILVPAQIAPDHRTGAAAIGGNGARTIGEADGADPKRGARGRGVRPLRCAVDREETAVAFARRQNRWDESCAIVF
ncbi:MAG: hypothetical protein BWX73_01778 [Lentisphaerae bacterium ADurb.Bin082]|nr:MAG: hypothetical protein BWX73_01778 [Lentisphaerae bacterium ADurb.Bin082]